MRNVKHLSILMQWILSESKIWVGTLYKIQPETANFYTSNYLYCPCAQGWYFKVYYHWYCLSNIWNTLGRACAFSIWCTRMIQYTVALECNKFGSQLAIHSSVHSSVHSSIHRSGAWFIARFAARFVAWFTAWFAARFVAQFVARFTARFTGLKFDSYLDSHHSLSVLSICQSHVLPHPSPLPLLLWWKE